LTAVVADLRDASALEDAAARVQAVVHTAYLQGPDLADVDLAAVRALLTGLRGRPDGTLIYLGGSTDYGDTGGRWVTEQDPAHPPTWQSWRPPLEAHVLEAAPRGIVIRPPLIYGNAGNQVLLGMLAQAAEGALPVVAGGQNEWSTVHVDDLADLVERLVTHPEARGIYNVASPYSISMRNLADTIAAAAGQPQSITHLDREEALRVLGPWAEGLSWNQRLDASRAINELRWTPRHGDDLADDLLRGTYRQRMPRPTSPTRGDDHEPPNR
jgi:nucleoside-diphosphate-sugar epimerase